MLLTNSKDTRFCRIVEQFFYYYTTLLFFDTKILMIFATYTWHLLILNNYSRNIYVIVNKSFDIVFPRHLIADTRYY